MSKSYTFQKLHFPDKAYSFLFFMGVTLFVIIWNHQPVISLHVYDSAVEFAVKSIFLLSAFHEVIIYIL